VGEEEVCKSPTEAVEETHEFAREDESSSGQSEDMDGKSGCNILNVMGIRSPTKGSGK